MPALCYWRQGGRPGRLIVVNYAVQYKRTTTQQSSVPVPIIFEFTVRREGLTLIVCIVRDFMDEKNGSL